MRGFLKEFIYSLHLLTGLFWLVLFFLPTAWWSGKISFQFFLTIMILTHQFFWGALLRHWTGKFRMVCFLTTVTQLLRGIPISDPQNYNHSFTRELFRKVGVPLPQRVIIILTLTIFTVATVQYFFFQ